MKEVVSDREKVIQGVLIGMSAVLLQRILEQPYWQVLGQIEESIVIGDSGKLIIAAALLVALNALRALPVFVGAFRAVEGISTHYRGRALVLAGGIVAAVFTVLYLVQGGQWEWGVPSAMFFAAAGLFLAWGRGVLKLWHKVIITAQLLFGLYWLGIMPMLTPFGFGFGELSTEIKLAARFLQAENTLNFISFAFFVPFVAIALITTGLIDNYLKIIKQINEKEKKEHQMQRIRLEAAEARVLQEMHALVHDLKTPLTTIRGLNSLVEMTAVNNDKQGEYAGRIEKAAENMNGMISEILYEDVREPIKVSALINYVRAQIVPEELEQKFYFHVASNLPHISINKVRMARALVNVIDNAVRATQYRQDAQVHIYATAASTTVQFVVVDNGDGVSPQQLEMVWEPGYSSRNSSGLGLTFVRKVVENHNGRIAIESKLGEGTSVTITIPGKEREV